MMDSKIFSYVFDYGFLSRAGGSGTFLANVNAFYGPWSLQAFNNGTIVDQITENVGCSVSEIPMGLTIAVYQEDGSLKEYWWYGSTNRWVEKLGGSGSGGGSTPIQNAMQVYATNNYFNIPVNADGKCSSAVLRRCTSTTLQVIYNGNILTQQQSDRFSLQFNGSDNLQIHKEFDATSGLFYIYLDFATSQDQMQSITDEAVSIIYKYEAVSGIIPLSIQASKSSLGYTVSSTPESLYIPDTGVIPSIYIDVDAYDPYDNETHAIPDSVSVQAEYAHIENDRYVRTSIGITRMDAGTGIYLIDGDSQLTLNGKTVSLQYAFQNAEFNEKYLKTGECIYVNILDGGVLQKSHELRIVRSSSIIGPGVKEYNIELQDEFITVPSSWIGQTDETTTYNIKMRTRNTVSVNSMAEVSDITIKNIKCQQDAADIYAITEDLDDTMTFQTAQESGKNIIGFYLSKLDGDQTVSLTVQFTINGKEYTDTVQTIIAQVENAGGDVYDVLCSNASLGVDLNDDQDTTSCSVSFHARKMNNGIAEVIPFSGVDYVFTKDTTANVEQGINIQLMHTQADLANHGITNIAVSYGSDKSEMNLTFTVNESQFGTFDLRFCLWVNGVIQDYGNIGMYANPKDGATYNIITNYESFPVDSLGRMSKETPNLTIRVDRILSGRVQSLKGASVSNNKINYSDSNAEFYFGYYSYGSTPATGNDFTDYYAKDTGETAQDVISYDTSTNSYTYNIYRNKYRSFGKTANVSIADDGSVSLINKGFCISVYCKTATGFKLVGTKTILATTPGSKGESGTGEGSATFLSIVFLRSQTTPKKPTGGSFENPIPAGWNDGIPTGTARLWASTRLFSTVAELQQAEWSEPYVVSDSDSVEFIFSSDKAPSTPQNRHPYPGDSSWSKTANDDTIWMAMSKCSGGSWSDWSIMRIKGEKGETGEKGRDGANGSQLRYLGTWNSTKCYCFQSRISVNEVLDGDQYKYDGKLYANIAKPDTIWTQDGLLYIDVVSVVKDNTERYFQATDNTCGISPLTADGNVNTGWEEASHFGMLITDYMIAKVVDASKVSANEIIIKDSDQKIIGGMTNSTSPTLPDKEEHLVFWTGSDGNDSDGKAGDSSKNAKFKVYDDGRVVCSSINSQINGLATSTSEIVVDINDLPLIEANEVESGNPFNAYYLDFTQYSTNIAITGECNGSISNPYLIFDFPSYWISGNSLYTDHGEVLTQLEKVGFSGTLSEGNKKEYQNAVYQYINFVNKYRTAQVRVRSIALSGLAGIGVRGCLTLGYNVEAGVPASLPYSNFVECSIGESNAGNIINTNSLNGYKLFLANDTSVTGEFMIAEKGENGGNCILGYPCIDRTVNDTNYTVFDISFKPQSFTFGNTDNKTFNSLGDYFQAIRSQKTGIYWETTNIRLPSIIDIEASINNQHAEKPSTYIK